MSARIAAQHVATAIGVLMGVTVGEDAVHASRAVRCALQGFVALEAGGGFGMPESVDESFARLVAMLDAGLRTTDGRPGPMG